MGDVYNVMNVTVACKQTDLDGGKMHFVLAAKV